MPLPWVNHIGYGWKDNSFDFKSEANVDCLVCHDLSAHQQGTVRLLTEPGHAGSSFALAGEPSELVSFCGKCHTGAARPTLHQTGAAWTFTLRKTLLSVL